MDPNGAAYRAARTMNGAPSSGLRGRSNRIPDWALFDSAHILGRYEIDPAAGGDGDDFFDLYADD
eukprot:CAMPEP_0181126346 /NCGR_PEP_ID=MMETSP1071-20121207/27574_1 /TAXON_ID=35127 /ORGANISM="Thalassiosira sp., Strain NH16" /LENGTH=64 /DNA_ID=CAMNT_0023211929 /DNA_START=119 /DNA_END=310 /DNA_ORIENTATION=+